MDHIDLLIQLALKEDIGPGDVTTDAVFADAIPGTARIYAKQDLVLAGMNPAQRVFAAVDQSVKWQATKQDGNHLKAGETVATVKGSVASLLKAERTALNFLQQLSGIATHTSRFVEKLKGSGAVLRDTRKTIPGWRSLSKEATRAGGAENHRMGLFDQFLIKDNHIAAAGSITACLERVRAQNEKGLKVQIEVRNAKEAAEAVKAGADSLLLDNMTHDNARAIAERYRDQIELEVSGNVTIDTIAEWGQTGVHAISVGALTHSAPAADIALEIKPSHS